jgi:hypothetical protein
MQHVEDLRANVSPTLRMGDAEKKAVRDHAGVRSWYARS